MDIESRTAAIVSAYYAADYLEGRLENLAEQDKLDLTLVICQDGSREAEIASQFLSKQVKILTTVDVPTVYQAWNLAITNLLHDDDANSIYVTNANSDDRLFPGAIAKLKQALDEHPKYAAAYGNQMIVEKIGGEMVGKFEWAEGGLAELMQGCFLGPMPMWRASLHQKYGLFNGDMLSAGDYEFWLRLAAGGERFWHVPEMIGAYLQTDSSRGNREPLRALWETARARARYRHGQ